jgi:hypothetical protein
MDASSALCSQSGAAVAAEVAATPPSAIVPNNRNPGPFP